MALRVIIMSKKQMLRESGVLPPATASDKLDQAMESLRASAFDTPSVPSIKEFNTLTSSQKLPIMSKRQMLRESGVLPPATASDKLDQAMESLRASALDTP
ncbi:hypothetical protein TSAR_006602, partial [Trichomalopsis sarcophagae]